jgi:hypothetical protein
MLGVACISLCVGESNSSNISSAKIKIRLKILQKLVNSTMLAGGGKTESYCFSNCFFSYQL